MWKTDITNIDGTIYISVIDEHSSMRGIASFTLAPR